MLSITKNDFSRRSWAPTVYELTAADERRMVELTESLKNAKVDHDDTIDDATQLAGRLPENLARALTAFRRLGNHGGTFLIRGIPVGDLPPTPRHANSVAAELTTASSALLTTACRLGDPICYAEEKNGALIHDVCPVAGEEAQQQNTGSTFFKMHIENTFHPYKPDFVLLLCLRPDHDRKARLLTSSAHPALRTLSPETLEILREPRFRTRLAPSFCRGLDGRPYPDDAPALEGTPDHPVLNVDFDDTVATDPDAAQALAALELAIDEAREEHTLDRGDLIVVDNRTTMHGRTAFTPRYDGADRWLQRIFVIADGRAAAPMLPMEHGARFRCRPLMG